MKYIIWEIMLPAVFFVRMVELLLAEFPFMMQEGEFRFLVH
jgi:hypothetical protein